MTKPLERRISSRMADWLLYNIVVIREIAENIEPGITANLKVTWARTSNQESKTEIFAIKKAAVTAVYDTLERSIKVMHPEHRAIYRMRYRAGLTYKDIKNRLHVSEKTVERRLADIRDHVSGYLEVLSDDTITEFRRILGE